MQKISKTAKRRLVLHVGHQKTGTSSIQVMLAGSNSYLRSKNFFYPSVPEPISKTNSVWEGPFRHNIIAGTYADYGTAFDRLSAEELDSFWERLSRDSCSPILSAEGLSRQRNFVPLAAALADYDVEVVAYVRRQDLFAESLYNQRNKILVQRGDPSFISEEFLTEADMFNFLRSQSYFRILSFTSLVNKIENQIQPTKIYVRVFDKKLLKGGDVCEDFAGIYDLDMEKLYQAGTHANGSISNAVLEEIKDVFLSKGELAARELMGVIRTSMRNGCDYSGYYGIFTDQSRKHFLDNYRNVNDVLREKYGVSFN